jgi:hypothetical protein
MNDESLRRANAFLSAAAERTEVGAVLAVTPAEIGRELSMPDALSTARAVRALIARRRLEPSEGSYRLLDSRPIDPNEPEALGRRPRGAVRRRPGGVARRGPKGDSTAYSDFGRAAIDRLIELGKEVAQLRASSRTAREEVRDAQAARDDAERRARSLAERVKELETRAEMAEANLRTILASARGREGARPDVAVGDSEMEAILGVLKGAEADAAGGRLTPPAEARPGEGDAARSSEGDAAEA